MTDINTRSLVLDMLLAINEEGQYSHLVLRQVLDKYQYLSKPDRAFLTRLTEGTIERQLTLDYVIDTFSKTKVRKMKPVIRNILRMGTYQIMYMDKVPDSAACNEAVGLAKKRGFSGLSGFVNGVLRAIARGYEDVQWPDADRHPAAALSVRYSIPEWIISMWMKTYGMDETKRIAEGFSGEAPFSIRVNLRRTTAEALREELQAQGVKVEAVEGLPDALFVSHVDYLNGLDSFRNGDFYVQDISSMRVAGLSGVKPGDYVIDVCAAPGGKSVHIAELLEDTGMVEARDLTGSKVGLIEENRIRHGISNMRAVQMDATVSDEASVERADVLICDLPCSGLGVMGKKPDIRYKMTEEKACELAALQRQILSTVHRYVKHGGTLVYSTCTIHSRENEENAAWFAQEYPEFALVSEEQIFPGAKGGDGFFLAKFVRK